MIYLSLNRNEHYTMVVVGNFLVLNQGVQEEQPILARYGQVLLTIAWK